jgi:hypothetical protein
MSTEEADVIDTVRQVPESTLRIRACTGGVL